VFRNGASGFRISIVLSDPKSFSGIKLLKLLFVGSEIFFWYKTCKTIAVH
jgi:hypothetical protein